MKIGESSSIPRLFTPPPSFRFCFFSFFGDWILPSFPFPTAMREADQQVPQKVETGGPENEELCFYNSKRGECRECEERVKCTRR